MYLESKYNLDYKMRILERECMWADTYFWKFLQSEEKDLYKEQSTKSSKDYDQILLAQLDLLISNLLFFLLSQYMRQKVHNIQHWDEMLAVKWWPNSASVLYPQKFISAGNCLLVYKMTWPLLHDQYQCCSRFLMLTRNKKHWYIWIKSQAMTQKLCDSSNS